LKNADTRTQALRKLAQKKHKDTLLKVTKALATIKEKDLPLNFQSVAKLAGISKTWLYNQPELKLEIENSRQESGKLRRLTDIKSSMQKKEIEVDDLKKKNKKLKETIKNLRHQLEVVYGELYKLKRESH
jgi:predicted RNase H-like nuclease (RuvC/YqgF family)